MKIPEEFLEYGQFASLHGPVIFGGLAQQQGIQELVTALAYVDGQAIYPPGRLPRSCHFVCGLDAGGTVVLARSVDCSIWIWKPEQGFEMKYLGKCYFAGTILKMQWTGELVRITSGTGDLWETDLRNLHRRSKHGEAQGELRLGDTL